MSNLIRYKFFTNLSDIDREIKYPNQIDPYFYSIIYSENMKLYISYIELIDKILINNDKFQDTLLLDGINFYYKKSGDKVFIKIQKIDKTFRFNKSDFLTFILEGLDFCIETSNNFQNKHFTPSYINTIERLRERVQARLKD